MGRFKCDNCGTYVMTIYKGGLCEGCYDKAKEETKMKNIEVGNLVRFTYSGGSSALGIVTWEKGNKFKAIWSDGNPYREMHIPLSKNDCITGVWELIDHTKEGNKTESKTIKGTDGLGTTTITTFEDKLHYAQEACNNALASVNGILQAHAEKNGEEKQPLKELFTFPDFDKSVSRTWKKQDFKDAVSNAALGLTGEAGEVADLIKKAVYHGRGFLTLANTSGKAILYSDVKDELSDVLFYVSAMAQEFGFTLEDVARHNKEKLEKRYSEGFTTKESAEKRDKCEGGFKHESN